MAAVRLQTSLDSLLEACKGGQEHEVAAQYGTFLYEARCLKANVGKHTMAKPALDAIDLCSSPL